MKIIDDFKCYKNNSLSKSGFAVIINPCFHTLVLYRISNFFYKNKIGIVAKVIWFLNRILFSVDIDYRANIESEVILIHGIGIVIGHEVTIEKGVKIYQGVTIGGNNGDERIVDGRIIKQPIIKSGTILGPNCMIFGPVIIGKDNFIKAGSIISRDI